MQKVWRIVATISLGVAPWLGPHWPALAQVDCMTRHLFVFDTGGNEAISWGEATTNYVWDMVPDPGCANSNRHGTAHIRDFLDLNAGIAEVGWIRGALFGAAERTYFFVGVRPPMEQQRLWYFEVGDPVNVNFRFKVQRVDWTNTWRFFFDNNLDGSSPTELCPF